MRVQRSAKLSTGHVVHVVLPGDDEFPNDRALVSAMFEAATRLRDMAADIERIAHDKAGS